MLVDIVGWVTPQASAARPKCRSFASASKSSSLSIKDGTFQEAIALTMDITASTRRSRQKPAPGANVAAIDRKFKSTNIILALIAFRYRSTGLLY
jgi:hypothetical protein